MSWEIFLIYTARNFFFVLFLEIKFKLGSKNVQEYVCDQIKKWDFKN